MSYEQSIRVLLTAHCSWLTAPLVNLAQQFAAHAFLASLAAGHDAARRGEDVDPHAAEHPGYLAAAHVDAAAGARHALDLGDGRLIVAAVLEVNPDHLVSL